MVRLLFCTVSLLALCVGGLLGAEARTREKAGNKTPPRAERRQPSDVIFILVEMSDSDPESQEELQYIYDTLRKIDKNQDGKLDAQELKAARHQLLEERVDRIFERLDTDKDGKISKEEARGRLKEHFDEIDTNHDGFISRGELLHAISTRVKEKAKKVEHEKPSSPPEER